MNYINVTVREKIARADGRARIVCGNSDYAIHFAFDKEWAEHDLKTARFVYEDGTYTDVQFEGEVCNIPILANTRTLQVGVYAGNLRTTTAALIHALPCVTDPDGTPADPAPDVYNQLMERFNTMEAPDAVLYTEQELTDDQKRQARANIKATGSDQFTIVNQYNEIASCGATSGVCRGGTAGVPVGLTFPAFFQFSDEHYGKRGVTMLDGDGKVWSGLANYSEIQNMTIVRTIPDWSQNDETAADYIKNRPFYEKSQTEVVFDGLVHNMQTYTLNFPLVSGLVYECNISGTTLNVICTEYGSGSLQLLFGSKGALNVSDPSKPLTAIYFGSGADSLLKITHKVTEIKKLDAKYLPEKFFVDLTYDDDGNAQVDKTFDEVQAAYNAGDDVWLRLPSNGITYPVYAFVPYRFIVFNKGESELAQFVFISPSGVMMDPQRFLPTASDGEPLPSGTASAGSDEAYARADHVHPRETLTVSVQKNSDGEYRFVTGSYADIQTAVTAGKPVFLWLVGSSSYGDKFHTYVCWRQLDTPGKSGQYYFRLLDARYATTIHTIVICSDTDIRGEQDTSKEIVLWSSTTGSSKKFKLTVDDSGAVTATEITD